MTLRVGHGIDIHQWEAGKELKLGGVLVPFHSGLKGHSDGDALLHAITDAVCGAVGRGDIGAFFPDTDPKWKDADSGDLLRRVIEPIHEAGWQVVNVDSTVLAEAPKLSEYRESIQKNIADLLSIEPENVGVKATTAEQLGFLGRGEGLLASAVVLMEKAA